MVVWYEILNSESILAILMTLRAVILMTDGISDPRFETDAGLKNQQKWQALWQEIEPHLQQEKPEQALLEWSKFFSAGQS